MLATAAGSSSNMRSTIVSTHRCLVSLKYCTLCGKSALLLARQNRTRQWHLISGFEAAGQGWRGHVDLKAQLCLRPDRSAQRFLAINLFWTFTYILSPIFACLSSILHASSGESEPPTHPPTHPPTGIVIGRAFDLYIDGAAVF